MCSSFSAKPEKSHVPYKSSPAIIRVSISVSETANDEGVIERSDSLPEEAVRST